jgi:hypothetical protein
MSTNPSAPDLARDHLGGQRHVVQDAGQLTRRFRVEFLLLDDVALDCDDGGRSVLDHWRLWLGWWCGLKLTRYAKPVQGRQSRISGRNA